MHKPSIGFSDVVAIILVADDGALSVADTFLADLERAHEREANTEHWRALGSESGSPNDDDMMAAWHAIIDRQAHRFHNSNAECVRRVLAREGAEPMPRTFAIRSLAREVA